MRLIMICQHDAYVSHIHTLKTGIPVEEGDCILKLLRRVSCPEIQLGVAFHSESDFFFNC